MPRLDEAQPAAPRGLPVETAVVLRDLAEYDTAFGVDIDIA